ncbi:ABC transporter ATP-binding protein [Pontibacillus sp. ALD_SL1]|uniref:ABC transporter ATP-binding protein n=1 Tax=Pontibacillus sp. ALD_SL1 TaxID=2777185 RepID=UPI001A978662|nr:ABC transporter ATP-binding protein [Pontibacillus sp. ALD_SL1]QST01697.1 ABC transporter ATP-binding protein [Pontibacillus sp. ALD_SL1]
MNLIEVNQIRKEYKSQPVVNDINFHIGKGEILGLLGPNGAGKSTTISMIASLLKPTSGDIIYEGKSVIAIPNWIRPKLGFVPQEIALYPEFTALENLQFFAKVYNIKRKERKDKINRALERVGLLDRAKSKVSEFSGGMKRRLNIACALIHEPDFLIMDEPTVGIDPQSRNHILDMVKQLNSEGMTVLYTTHYMEEVEAICDRIIIMDHGKIIAQGTKKELIHLIQHQDHLEMKVEARDAQFEEAILLLNGVHLVEYLEDAYVISIEQNADLLPELFQVAKQHGVHIFHLQVKQPRLEDVFLHLTGRTLRDQ